MTTDPVETPAGVHEAQQLAEMVARGPFWQELQAERAEVERLLAALDSLVAERDRREEAIADAAKWVWQFVPKPSRHEGYTAPWFEQRERAREALGVR